LPPFCLPEAGFLNLAISPLTHNQRTTTLLFAVCAFTQKEEPMIQTPDQLRQNVRVLEYDMLYLEEQLEGLDPDSFEAESMTHTLDVKRRLLSDQLGQLNMAQISLHAAQAQRADACAARTGDPDAFAVPVVAIVTPTTVSDIMVTAVEGGCEYWLSRFKVRGSGAGAYSEPSSFRGDWVVDIETDGDGHATITKTSLQKAMHDNPEWTMAISDGSFDADTVDALLQCAAFGKVVYG